MPNRLPAPEDAASLATVLIAKRPFGLPRSLIVRTALLLSMAAATSWHASGHAKELRPPHANEIVNTQIEPNFRPSFGRCMKRVGEALQKKAVCIESERVYQDKLLNLNYKKLMRILPTPQKNELRDDQKKWLAEKDRVCALVAPPGADAAQVIDSKYCVMHRTALQARELNLLIALEKTSK